MNKNILIIILVFLFVINIVNSVDQEYVNDANTVALYHFNEISGNIAYDETGNYNGTIVNGQTRSTNSPFITNSSLDLDGVDDYVSISPYVLNNLPQGTIEARIYVRSLSPIGGYIVVSKGTNSLTNLIISVSPYTSKLSAHMGTGLYFESNRTINLNQWYKMALTWDGIKWKFYIDDKLDNEINATEIPINDNINEFKIGRHNHGAGPFYADGLIDEVRISNIAKEFNSTINEIPSLIGNSTIDNNTEIVIDNSTNLTQQYNGTLTVMFKQANEIVAEFNYNFSEAPLNLTNIYVGKGVSASKAYIILRGLELQDNNTKTLYMDNISTNLNWVCIKDAEINSINEISRTCHAPNEYHIQCNGENFNGYTCNKVNGNFVITGLRHSAVAETLTDYGDLDGDTFVGPVDLNIMRNIRLGLNVNCYEPVFNSDGIRIGRNPVSCNTLIKYDPCSGDAQLGSNADYLWIRNKVLGQFNPVCSY